MSPSSLQTGKKKGDKNKRRHDKASNRKSLFPLTTPLNDVMGRLCIPPSVDRLVYFLKVRAKHGFFPLKRTKPIHIWFPIF